MKEFRLKQYIEVFRTVSVMVEDNETEIDAAKKLNEMPICLRCNETMPGNATVLYDWNYVSDGGIEDLYGETILNAEEC